MLSNELEIPMLSTAEAAARVGCAPVTLARYRIAGDGPIFVKIGRLVKYRDDDLENWIVGKRRTSTSQVN
jgi:hypothetical protein